MSVEIRARTSADLPALVDLLWDQQPESSYPLRNPLPFPTSSFLHADDADAAWTATIDGRPAGHVCRTTGHPDPAVERTCAEAHGCAIDELGWVSTLYVGRSARGLGLGRRLLGTVVADLRAAGRRPCLEVYPARPAAMALYTSHGWREVMRTRPEWLRAVLDDEGPDVRILVLLDRAVQSSQSPSRLTAAEEATGCILEAQHARLARSGHRHPAARSARLSDQAPW